LGEWVEVEIGLKSFKLIIKLEVPYQELKRTTRIKSSTMKGS
jgi:hypothetical protein